MPSARRFILAATIIGSSLTFIDGTAVNVALPALQADLRASITEVQWVIEAYALFLGALILVGGSVGDQAGRRKTFLTGVALFTGASIACGIAGSANTLIAARALQGVGAAFLVPGSLAIISATFDDADRGRAIGTWSGFTAIMTAVGPVLGGWLIDHVSWRAVFFLNVPLTVVVFILALRYIPESRDPSRSHRVDWTGATLATLGLGFLVLALLEWPRAGASAPLIAGSAIAGVVSLALFLVVERTSRNPMLPLGVFRSRTFALTNVLTLLLYGALGITMFLVPLNLIEVQRYTATQAGAAFLPVPVIVFALSRWSGGLVARVPSRVPLTAGPLIAAAGIALYARLGIGGSYWATVFPAATLLGCGLAVTVAPLTTTVMGAVEREHAGVASGINNAVARVAGLLAIAVFGVLLAGVFRARVGPALDRLALPPAARAEVDRELPRMAGADLTTRALSEAQREPVRAAIAGAFISAFRRVITSAAVLAVLAGLVGALLR